MAITDKIIDKAVDIFFSKDKTKLYLLIFFIIGFVLRLINVLNAPTGIDASGHALQAIGFISSGKLTIWSQSTGLWHFLTDLSYKLFGLNDFGARFFVLVFGSLSIIMIFFVTKEMFGRKTGLIAAFLLAVSPFHISETIPEMDAMTLFFVLLGMFIFVRALKQNKKNLFLLAGIAIGTAMLVKLYSILYAPAFVLYAVYYSWKYKIDKKTMTKNVAIFLIAAFVFTLIPLVSNYLLYKDKGFADYIFTDTLGLWNEKSKQYYGWVGPYVHEYLAFFIGGSEKIPSKLPVFIWTIGSVLYADILVLIFGLLGIFFAIKRENKDYLFMAVAIFFTVYLYIGSVSGLMAKHYLFLLITFIPFAALSLEEISKKINIRILLALIIIFQLYWLITYSQGHFWEKSGLNQLNSYKTKIPEDSLVVYDSRIFRGLGTYIFSDKHYIEASYFSNLLNSQEQLPGEYKSMKVYFIECENDDCGWGTIKDQPEFNASMEQIVDFFKNNSQLIASIREKREKKSLSFAFKIYRMDLKLKPSSLAVADSTHIFWMNPLGYDEKIAPVFDKYKTSSAADYLLDKLAHYILYFSVIFALLSVFIAFYLLITENEA